MNVLDLGDEKIWYNCDVTVKYGVVKYVMVIV